MDKVDGIELGKKWPELKGAQKRSLVKAMIELERKFASTSFKMFGSLYYAEDVANSNADNPLYTTDGGEEVRNTKFVVGPTTDRKFFDDGRGTVNVDVGPCTKLFRLLW